MTNIDEIIDERDRLNRQLRIALATMEKKDTIREIQAKMRINQAKCPHFDTKYNFVWANDTCPYCGKTHCVNPKEA